MEVQIMQNHIENALTEIVFIVDRGSSMSRLEDDSIGGFN